MDRITHTQKIGHSRLKGFPEAITAAFPDALVQTCPRHGHSDQWRSHGSMHLVRHSLSFCS